MASLGAILANNVRPKIKWIAREVTSRMSDPKVVKKWTNARPYPVYVPAEYVPTAQGRSVVLAKKDTLGPKILALMKTNVNLDRRFALTEGV